MARRNVNAPALNSADMKPPAAAIFRRGQKEELFDALSSGTTDDATVLDAKLNELCSVWAVPRAGKDFAAGIWRPDIGAVEVVVKGKQTLMSTGFMMSKKLYLHIEEAVYLVDRSNLLLFVVEAGGAKRLLALQEAYALMEALGVSIERYVLYSHLSRAGFVVKRYPSRFTLQGTERPHEVWGTTPAWRCCDGRTAGDTNGSNGSTAEPVASTSAAAPEQPRKRHKREQAPEATHRSWWPEPDKAHPWLGGATASSLEAPSIPTNPSVSAELRQRHPRLRPLPSIRRPSVDASVNAAGPNPCSHLVYDVYPCGACTKRASPDSVAFRLCIVSDSHFPSLQDIQAAAQASPDAPVRMVSVEDGDCMFFDVQVVNVLDSIKQPRL